MSINQNRNVRTAVGMSLLAVGLVSASAFADVTFDPEGIPLGFAGKGDVQQVFDWNNAQLQENHSSIQFRFANEGTATWQCEWYTGPDHNRTYHVQTKYAETSAVSSSVAYDPRKNKQGQVTGFNLIDLDLAVPPEVEVPGTCGAEGNAMKTLVEGSLTESGEPALQVSIDGVNWYDLAISY